MTETPTKPVADRKVINDNCKPLCEIVTDAHKLMMSHLKPERTSTPEERDSLAVVLYLMGLQGVAILAEPKATEAAEKSINGFITKFPKYEAQSKLNKVVVREHVINATDWLKEEKFYQNANEATQRALEWELTYFLMERLLRETWGYVQNTMMRQFAPRVEKFYDYYLKKARMDKKPILVMGKDTPFEAYF